jgi:predicted ATPase/class 3 adenylate cyclase
VSAIPEPASNALPLPIPSGRVTFVFTDIEGSTRRWELDPSAMQRAVRQHDALVRREIVRNGGHVFKTIGDAFCAAFTHPPDAVAAILAIQRALALEDFSAVDGIRVRAALHTGTADERDGDYFGPTVNRVARLLSIAHGGQVVLSGVTTDLVLGELPPDSSLQDLGEHRLKDLARPERVHQLVAPDLPAQFAPLNSLDTLPNNLPVSLTSFVGRETEIEEIAASLATHRLVTLTGSGGVGKTRTSLQVAANLVDTFRDGVWFVELAPLTDGALIASTVAAAAGLTLSSTDDAVQSLALGIGNKIALLVFDNCEHVVESAASVVAKLLRACPKLKVLASSRQSLGIAAEATYYMPSLGVPEHALLETFVASDAERYSALTLFVDRARAVDRSFELRDDNVYAIADICRRLDGIPLAIELAAARVKILSPRQLRDRLDERFRVLTGGSRDLLPRQQTLRALIDWSFDLLDERERTLFRRLSIFVDGLTLEAATIAGDTGQSELDILELLSSLVDKSLVIAEPAGDSLRYRLLESTNAYAREKLVDAGELDSMTARHLAYVHGRFSAAWNIQEATGQSNDLSRMLMTELGNVRAALNAALGGANPSAGGEILVFIDNSWDDLGLQREKRGWTEAFVEKLADADPLLVAKLSVVQARIAGNSRQSSFEAGATAVARARDTGDARTIVEALLVYAWCAASFGRFDDANAALGEAERIPVPSVRLRLAVLNARAFVSYHCDDLATASLLFEQLAAEHRALGNPSRERMALLALAEVEHGRGDTVRAIDIVRGVLLGVEKNRLRILRASLLSNLAGYLIAVNDHAGARVAACEALDEIGKREPETEFVTNAMQHLALALTLEGDSVRAATLAGYFDAAIERHGYQRERNETASRDRLMNILHEAWGTEELERLFARGANLSPHEAVRLALRESHAATDTSQAVS